MHPTHHLHISTGFMFVLVMLVLGLVGLFFWACAARRASRERIEIAKVRAASASAAVSEPGMSAYVSRRDFDAERPRYASTGSGSTAYHSAPPPAPAPAAYAAPAVIHTGGSGSDMMTGVLLGSMISGHGHHDTTVVHDRTVVHDSAPAATSSWDSGFSYSSGSDSSSSSDSGGFSFDW